MTPIRVVAYQDGRLLGQYLLEPGEYTLGKAEDCSIVLRTDAVSSYHATLIVAPEGLAVEDLGSAEGTFLDGQPVVSGRAPFAASQVLQLGGVVLQIPQEMAAEPLDQFARKVGGGRFTLLKEIGRGGMGVVWLAHDRDLDSEVAVKLIPEDVAASRDALAAMREEVLKNWRLTHPHIIRIHDFLCAPGEVPIISMEYIEGQNLAEMKERSAGQYILWEHLEPMVQQICSALDYAHQHGIAHLDLKPSNLILDSTGRLRLADFGIAAILNSARVSQGGGTLLYMSPQQMQGLPPSTLDDIYSLGATLYELLTGQAPFYLGDIVEEVLHAAPEPIEKRLERFRIQNDVPSDVCAMVMACLSKDPEQRPPNAQAVADWLGISSLETTYGGAMARAVSARAKAPAAPAKPREIAPVVTARQTWVFRGVLALILAALAAGAFYYLPTLVRGSRTVFAWGSNDQGQTSVPYKLGEARALAAGKTHSMALMADGSVVIWSQSKHKALRPSLPAHDVVAIAAGDEFCAALLRNGRVAVWGKPWEDLAEKQAANGADKEKKGAPPYSPSELTNVVKIAAGDAHLLLLTRNGSLYELIPGKGILLVEPPAGTGLPREIAAGGDQNAVLTIDGSVVAWHRSKPSENVAPMELREVRAVAVGQNHFLALKRDGAVAAWGSDDKGQLAVPKEARQIEAIAAGGGHSLALTRSGKVIAWGGNASGQTKVPFALGRISGIAAGGSHSLALKASE